MRVLDTFLVPDRGLIVSTDEAIAISSSNRCFVTVRAPDGTNLSAEVVGAALGQQDYLLLGVGKDEVPVGSLIKVG